jgi:hypothetical protein
MQLGRCAREVLVAGGGCKHPQLTQRDVFHNARILRPRYSEKLMLGIESFKFSFD